MKLRFKENGKIGKLLAIGYSSEGIILLLDVNGYRELCIYHSLAEMNEEWEDYDEADKPALTEKERDYLIAWLKLLDYVSYDSVKRNTKRLELMHGKQSVSSIPTFGRFRWWPDGISFKLEELGVEKA